MMQEVLVLVPVYILWKLLAFLRTRLTAVSSVIRCSAFAKHLQGWIARHVILFGQVWFLSGINFGQHNWWIILLQFLSSLLIFRSQSLAVTTPKYEINLQDLFWMIKNTSTDCFNSKVCVPSLPPPRSNSTLYAPTADQMQTSPFNS